MALFFQPPPPIEVPKDKLEFISTMSAQPRNEDIFSQDVTLFMDLVTKEKFLKYRKAWEKNTRYSSSITKIIEDENFQRILKLGPRAIPFIVNDISMQPSNLVWAMNIITGASLSSNKRLTITEACQAWVKIYQRGAIKF